MAAQPTTDIRLVESDEPLQDKGQKDITASYLCHRQTSKNFPPKLSLAMCTTDGLSVSKSLGNLGCLLGARSAHKAWEKGCNHPHLLMQPATQPGAGQPLTLTGTRLERSWDVNLGCLSHGVCQGFTIKPGHRVDGEEFETAAISGSWKRPVQRLNWCAGNVGKGQHNAYGSLFQENKKNLLKPNGKGPANHKTSFLTQTKNIRSLEKEKPF